MGLLSCKQDRVESRRKKPISTLLYGYTSSQYLPIDLWNPPVAILDDGFLCVCRHGDHALEFTVRRTVQTALCTSLNCTIYCTDCTTSVPVAIDHCCALWWCRDAGANLVGRASLLFASLLSCLCPALGSRPKTKNPIIGLTYRVYSNTPASNNLGAE